MKRVVKVVENKVVDINSVDNVKYYGFRLYDGSLGQIVGDDMFLEKDNCYQAKFFTGSTVGKSWIPKCSSLKDCIDSILSSSDKSDVFEFDTYQELFKWASTT